MGEISGEKFVGIEAYVLDIYSCQLPLLLIIIFVMYFQGYV